MTNAVFLGSILPPLFFGSRISISFTELISLFRMNMSDLDWKKVEVIRRYIDLKNVLHILKEEILDPRGNLSEKELDEALVNRDGLPEYLFDYLDTYDTKEEQIRHFSSVFVQFFKDPEQQLGEFLQFYLNFEREWRLILAAFRAKKLHLDLTKELQYEDFTDPMVVELLARKEGDQFEFPYGYEELGVLLKSLGGNPLEQYQRIAEFRFHQIEEKIQDTPHSIQFVLGYLIQFMIVEDWNALNEKQGNTLLTTLYLERG